MQLADIGDGHITQFVLTYVRESITEVEDGESW